MADDEKIYRLTVTHFGCPWIGHIFSDMSSNAGCQAGKQILHVQHIIAVFFVIAVVFDSATLPLIAVR
ncbi:MAG: hypothetical protein PHC49_13430 [Desulfuromonadaceae bacterium]|nr:hypothetical protein [Desulfuromonadaceae bacterium]